jgi:hypothetical protein
MGDNFKIGGLPAAIMQKGLVSAAGRGPFLHDHQTSGPGEPIEACFTRLCGIF